jgi:GcrA cell cycle regulator
MTKQTWTPERISILTAMWERGKTASFIAEKLGMGITRSAVIGKAHRMGLKKLSKRRQNEELKRLRGKALLAQAMGDCASVVPIKENPPSKPTVKLSEIRNDQCHWIFGEPKGANSEMCGARAVPGRDYCAYHCGKMFTAARDFSNFVPQESERRDEQAELETLVAGGA